jgi:hypothetical protein
VRRIQSLVHPKQKSVCVSTRNSSVYNADGETWTFVAIRWWSNMFPFLLSCMSWHLEFSYIGHVSIVCSMTRYRPTPHFSNWFYSSGDQVSYFQLLMFYCEIKYWISLMWEINLTAELLLPLKKGFTSRCLLQNALLTHKKNTGHIYEDAIFYFQNYWNNGLKLASWRFFRT